MLLYRIPSNSGHLQQPPVRRYSFSTPIDLQFCNVYATGLLHDPWGRGQWMQNVLKAENLHVVVLAESLLPHGRAGMLEQHEIA